MLLHSPGYHRVFNFMDCLEFYVHTSLCDSETCLQEEIDMFCNIRMTEEKFIAEKTRSNLKKMVFIDAQMGFNCCV